MGGGEAGSNRIHTAVGLATARIRAPALRGTGCAARSRCLCPAEHHGERLDAVVRATASITADADEVADAAMAEISRGAEAKPVPIRSAEPAKAQALPNEDAAI